MSDEQYRTYQKTGKRTVTGYNLLFQTGGAPDNQGGGPNSAAQDPQRAGAPTQPSSTVGRNPNFPLDYYIDSINFENYLPGKSVQSAHSVKTLKFSVIEPANISLIDNMYKAVQQIKPTDASGAVNYAAAHYLMVIRFYGYDEQGRVQKVGAADPRTGLTDPNAVIEKVIPFKIADINWSVSNKLVTYEFQCVPTDQIIASGTRRGSIPADVELAGGTVREILAGGVIYSGAPATTEAPGSPNTAGANQTDGAGPGERGGRLDRGHGADHRNLQHIAHHAKRNGRGGVAGDAGEARLVALRHPPQQPCHPRGDLRLGLGAIGQAGEISGIDHRRVRQHFAQGVVDGQPADAGIEQQDGGI
jgi:hypothetical protein